MDVRLPSRLLSLLITLLALVSTAEATTTFKIATVVPDGTHWMQQFRASAKTISQQTEGRVAFKFYPGGVMGNDKNVMRKMRAGQRHGGAFTGGSLAKVDPNVQVYSLPFVFDSLREVDYVRERMDALLQQGIERHGLVLAGIGEGGFAYMMSNKPLRSISDLAGQKIWIPEDDQVNQATFREAGVTPIPLPIADTYTGLQTGLIDTVAVSPVGALAFQWHTKVEYVTDTPLIYLAGFLVFDKKQFSRLSTQDQQTVLTITRDTFARIDARNRIDNEKATQALINQGLKFVTPSEDDVREWRAIARKVIDQLGQAGLFDTAVYEQLVDHLATFRARTHAAN